MGKEKAYIDGKNVSADWIEEIFDDFIRYGNNAESYIGVINDTPCGCTVYKTHILWWIKKTQSNAKTAYNTMMCRLLQRDMDDTFFCEYIFNHNRKNFVFTQEFFWRHPA